VESPSARLENPNQRLIMKIQWMAAVGILALLPGAAMAQTAEERIVDTMTRAGEAGIPVSLLENNMAEGRAKGIPMDQIAAAVERRLEALERAREAMGRGASDVDAAQLSLGADALGAGVSDAVLEEIATSTTGDRRGVAVVALTQLVLEGDVPEDALLRVQEALLRGPEALAALTGRADAAGAAGAAAAVGTPGAAQGGLPGTVPAPGQVVTPPVPPRSGPPGGGF
jgi:hypothetical protein